MLRRSANFLSRFYTACPPKLPTIPAIELEEKFIKGGGPGGQALNKASSCVQLRHIPTATIIKTQRFRSLAQNRKEALKLMQLALDDLEKGTESKRGLKSALEIEKERKRKSKSKKKYAEREKTELGGEETENKNIVLIRYDLDSKERERVFKMDTITDEPCIVDENDEKEIARKASSKGHVIDRSAENDK